MGIFSSLRKILAHPGFFLAFQKWVSRDYKLVRQAVQGEDFLKEKGRYLDLACGVGVLSSLFPSGDYVGVDLDEVYIAYGKEHFPGHFLVMDARHLAFGDDSFDRVFICHFTHHLSDDDVALMNAEVSRVLTRAGKVMVIDAIEPLSKMNVVGRIFKNLDEGQYIRSIEGYRRLFSSHFAISQVYPLRSWPHDYCVFVLEPRVRMNEQTQI